MYVIMAHFKDASGLDVCKPRFLLDGTAEEADALRERIGRVASTHHMLSQLQYIRRSSDHPAWVAAALKVMHTLDPAATLDVYYTVEPVGTFVEPPPPETDNPVELWFYALRDGSIKAPPPPPPPPPTEPPPEEPPPEEPPP
jgi:hypothetical protein